VKRQVLSGTMDSLDAANFRIGISALPTRLLPCFPTYLNYRGKTRLTVCLTDLHHIHQQQRQPKLCNLTPPHRSINYLQLVRPFLRLCSHAKLTSTSGTIIKGSQRRDHRRRGDNHGYMLDAVNPDVQTPPAGHL
jgi:hypothetical protein